MDLECLRKEIKIQIEKAIQFENQNKLEEAKCCYNHAIKRLNLLVKHDENVYAKDVYQKKIEAYSVRIKELDSVKEKDNKISSDSNNLDDNLKGQLSGCLIAEKPNVKWSDVAGLEKAKEALKEAVILPIKFPNLFSGKRKPWKGILLYGPPGTGKSYLAKAAATEAGGKFFSVSAANIVSKFMGESERLVKGLFDMARANKPAVIFLDEIDSVMSARTEGEGDATRRLKTEFLVQMQGVGSNDDGILVLGATNIPWALDPAVRRRFQKKIYISLPDVNARKEMFKLNIGDTDHILTEENFIELAQITEGFSGSDIATLTQDAIYEPLRKCQLAQYFKKVNEKEIVPCSPSEPGAMKMTMTQIPNPNLLKTPPVDCGDYFKAMTKIKATVDKKDLIKQDQFTKEFGQEG